MLQSRVILEFCAPPPPVMKDKQTPLVSVSSPSQRKFIGKRLCGPPCVMWPCNYTLFLPFKIGSKAHNCSPGLRIISSHLVSQIYGDQFFSIKSCHTSTCPFSLYVGIIHWPHPLASPLITPFGFHGPVPPSTACDNTALIPLFSQSLPWMKERI